MTFYRIWSHQIGKTFYYRTRARAMERFNLVLEDMEKNGIEDFVLTLDSVAGNLSDNFNEDTQQVMA